VNRSMRYLPLLVGLALAGCGAEQRESFVDKAANLIVFQQTTRPTPSSEPPRQTQETVVFGDLPGGGFDCPPIVVLPDGAAIRAQAGGDASAVRYQISIQDTSRECLDVRPDGSFTLRLGVQGRVVIGPSGGPGTYGATLRIDVRRGGNVVASRAVRVGATVRPGEGGADFAIVEQGLRVPGSGEADIELALTSGAAPRARTARR
jgi:glucose/arabinose dehydrogenase